jgi:hypothetical protein
VIKELFKGLARKCPACGQAFVERADHQAQAPMLGLVLASGLWKDWHCRGCDHRW